MRRCGALTHRGKTSFAGIPIGTGVLYVCKGAAVNLLRNILKAVGIVIGAYVLLFAGIWVMVRWHFRTADISDFGVKASSEDLWLTLLVSAVLPFLLALGALYLPPRGRMYAALGALLLLVGILIHVGIQIASIPRD